MCVTFYKFWFKIENSTPKKGRLAYLDTIAFLPAVAETKPKGNEWFYRPISCIKGRNGDAK